MYLLIDELAKSSRCTDRRVRRIRSTLKHFGPLMLVASYKELKKKLSMVNREVIVVIPKRFDTEVLLSSITRALPARAAWT